VQERTKALIFATVMMLSLSGLMAWGLWVRNGALAGVGFFLAYNIVTVYVWLPWKIRKKIHRW
jgi:hypothetical protein